MKRAKSSRARRSSGKGVRRKRVSKLAAKTARRSPKAPKTSPSHKIPKTIDEYLALTIEPARSTLSQVRAAIRFAVPPEATEVISYRIPAFKHKQVLVWFAAFSDHCSFFPTAAVIEQFRADLKPYSISKGTIQFPIDKPLPSTLIQNMVKARLANVASKRRG